MVRNIEIILCEHFLTFSRFIVVTPSKKARTVVDSPALRRTRKSSLSESIDVTASPLRRTTRAMSNDREVTASPVPSTRASRRSAVNESDDDSTVDLTVTPGRTKTMRKNARKSTMISPTIDLIEEEPEEEKLEISKDESEMNADELELRNRSISKSPASSISPLKARELSVVLEKVKDKSGINFSALENEDDDDEEMEKPGKIFKHRHQFSKDKTSGEAEISFNDGGTSMIEKYSSKAKRLSAQKTTFDDVMERLSKETENEDDSKENGNESKESIDLMMVSPSKLVRGRRSIHGEGKSESEDELTKMMEDFVPDDDVVMNTPQQQSKSKASKTPENVAKTPKNASKSPKIIETPKTPKTSEKLQETPKTAPKTPKSVNEVLLPQSKEKTPKTPQSTAKTPGTPNGSGKTPKSVSKMTELVATPQNNVKTPQGAVKTPKSAVKTPKNPSSKTPENTPKLVICEEANAEETLGADEMDITKDASISDMEISMTSNRENEDSNISPVLTDVKEVSIEKISRRSLGQKAEVQQNDVESPKVNKSFTSYLEQVTKSSERRKTLGNGNGETVSSSSWTQSVRRSAPATIDASHEKEPEVIKASPRKRKPISSDESDDDHENNSFVDDEAEVGSEGESITESERQYLKDHEIPEDGESIGSQDSNEFDEEEDDDENNSFIDDDEVSVTYDLNSEEEKIESEEKPKKRKSRIIAPSSSEDEDEEKADEKPEKEQKEEQEEIPVENGDEEMAAAPETPEESPEVAPAKTKKRKRDSGMNESVVGKKKRVRLNDSANEAEAMHMEDLSAEVEEVAEPKKPKKVKKDAIEPRDIASVLSKCNEFMGAYETEKKAKMALKREKKAVKKAKKQEALKAAGDNLDSSNGENKENAPKKKKKKAKKQKPVEGEFLCCDCESLLLTFDYS